MAINGRMRMDSLGKHPPLVRLPPAGQLLRDLLWVPLLFADPSLRLDLWDRPLMEADPVALCLDDFLGILSPCFQNNSLLPTD